MKKRFTHGKGDGLRTAVLGILLGVVSLLVFALVFAFIAYMGSDPTALTGIFSIISLLLCSLVMGIFISRRGGDGGIGLTALSVLVLLGIMLLIEVIANGGAVSAAFIINCATALGVSIIGARIGKPRARRRRRR